MQLAIRALQCYVPKARPYARAFLTPVSSKLIALGRAFGTFHMQLTIRALLCYVPKARPYARAFLTPFSSKLIALAKSEFCNTHN